MMKGLNLTLLNGGYIQDYVGDDYAVAEKPQTP